MIYPLEHFSVLNILPGVMNGQSLKVAASWANVTLANTNACLYFPIIPIGDTPTKKRIDRGFDTS